MTSKPRTVSVPSVSRNDALEAVRTLLSYLGENPDREGLLDTPGRVLDSYRELYAGYTQDPEKILNKTFACDNDDMVILKNIELTSVCEHHLLPFTGVCHIGYLPDKKVAGLSKLARLMDVFARRLQIQENLTREIALALDLHLKPLGVGVIVEARHMCMSCRGVKKQDSAMLTSAMLGEFKKNAAVKREFVERCKN